MSWFLRSFVAFFLAFQAAGVETAFDNGRIKVNCSSTIYVDQSGRGNFNSIQAAVESVPQNNQNWICISIKQGVYRERVYIPYGKPYIYLVGEGMKRTQVVWDGHNPMDTTATFNSQADNIIADSISFINSYNYPPSETRNPRAPALAAKIEGDKSAFYSCGFYGVQDTLWDVTGRHYFKLCTIEGAVDFIFGAGQSIYEKCVISVIGQALNGGLGFITAQGRGDPRESSGFVFKHCNIIGNGKAYLGRPWRKYARVVYFKSFMSDVVVPQGWDAYFNSGGQEGLLTFIEKDCIGAGANTSGRAKWANRTLSDKELNQLISIKYINRDGWLSPNMIL